MLSICQHLMRKLHEDCFVMKDPFSSTGGFITIGSKCSMCHKRVCMSGDCSLYYTRRFCLTCAKKNLQEFPMEIQHEISSKIMR